MMGVNHGLADLKRHVCGPLSTSSRVTDLDHPGLRNVAYARLNRLALRAWSDHQISQHAGLRRARRGPLLQPDSRSLRWAAVAVRRCSPTARELQPPESHREPTARSRAVSAQPRTRGLRAVLVAGGIAVLLAGCAAGQVTSTAEIVPVVDGALATVSTMDLRAIAVAPPTDRSWAEGSSGAAADVSDQQQRDTGPARQGIDRSVRLGASPRAGRRRGVRGLQRAASTIHRRARRRVGERQV